MKQLLDVIFTLLLTTASVLMVIGVRRLEQRINEVDNSASLQLYLLEDWARHIGEFPFDREAEHRYANDTFFGGSDGSGKLEPQMSRIERLVVRCVLDTFNLEQWARNEHEYRPWGETTEIVGPPLPPTDAETEKLLSVPPILAPEVPGNDYSNWDR